MKKIKIISQQIPYMLAFGWQCAKHTAYGVTILSIELTRLVMKQITRIWD